MSEPVKLRTVNLTRSFPSGGGEVTVLKGISLELPAQKPVSYTHLDVYKRQAGIQIENNPF